MDFLKINLNWEEKIHYRERDSWLVA